MKLVRSKAKFLLSIVYDLNLIKFASLHTQEAVDGNTGADGGDDNAKAKHHHAGDDQFTPRHDGDNLRLTAIEAVETEAKRHASQQRS